MRSPSSAAIFVLLAVLILTMTFAGYPRVSAFTGGHYNVVLSSPSPLAGGGFGQSVAISGQQAVVGAYGETAGGQTSAGNAYIYNSTTGALLHTLSSPSPQSGGYFGWSVAVDSKYVVVGAEGETIGASKYAGHAYIFNSTTGALLHTLTSPNAQSRGFFGWSVAISGNDVIVGATNEASGAFSEAGNAYLFNAKTGALVKSLASPNAQTGGGFGYSVGIAEVSRSKVAIVGAYAEKYVNNATLIGAGNAYSFNATTGALISTLLSPNPAIGGGFGGSVAITSKTSLGYAFFKATVGASGEPVGALGGAGRAYEFDPRTGGLLASMQSPSPQAGGNFGESVALGQSYDVVVGAPGETSGGQLFAGNVYLFAVTSSAKLYYTLVSKTPAEGGNFGWSVADTKFFNIVIGAPNENAGGQIGAGNAYSRGKV